jgi:flagellar operon protein
MEPHQIGSAYPIDANAIPANGSSITARPAGSPAFAQLVQANQRDAASQSTTGVTLSAHAQERLRMRNISLNDDDLKRIATTMDRVAEKGGRQSLFLLKTSAGQDAAMVVSVRNRVIITAVDGESLRENIFTNIDSAAIVS